jgi:CheY-like chemotaxis protein
MMGGDISVSSQLGVGTTFKVVLPLQNAEPPEFASQPAVLGDRRLRVLAAEDHPINLKFMSILLEKMGHEAAFCENGREALELVRTQPFDVVLMDLHMPEMDGLSATRAIRELDGPASQVKIILVTADVVNDTREKALIAGIDAFAAKPLQIEDLRRALKHCGLMSSMSDESAPPSAPGQFQMSAYEAPVDLPVQRDLQPMNYVDGPVFREIVDMMPDDTLSDLLHELFNEPHGAVHGLLDALAAGDRHAIGQAAHKLKGTSMLLGLKAIVKTTAALEHKARQTQDPIPPGTADDLNFDIFQTRQALDALGMPVTRKADQDSAAIAKMG